MRPGLIAITVAIVIFFGPLVLGIVGVLRTRGMARAALPKWDWRVSVASALLYVLAFNLTFFIQELFLVLPKAFTPGLRPTLFHNNHTWQGHHELASLFQGTGALAILIVGVSCALLLRDGGRRLPVTRLFLVWMAYNGFFQSLPQVVVGAFNPQNDVGMAMEYFDLSVTCKILLALSALATMPFVALWLAWQLLALADLGSGESKTRFVFLAATLPALAAVALIIPFRVPREVIEVVILPVVVTVIGVAWMQAGAWRLPAAPATVSRPPWPIARLSAAVVILLAIFQFILRPGIQFF